MANEPILKIYAHVFTEFWSEKFEVFLSKTGLLTFLQFPLLIYISDCFKMIFLLLSLRNFNKPFSRDEDPPHIDTE